TTRPSVYLPVAGFGPTAFGVPSSPYVRSSPYMIRSRPGGGGLGFDLLQQTSGFAAMQPGNVVLVFEQHPQGVVDRVRVEFEHVELHQRLGPIDRLGDAGEL